MKKRGFTLIELLVVIAVVALNSARVKGSDAAIKSNLNTVRSEAALWYNENNGNYAGVDFPLATCPSTVQTENLFADTDVISALKESINNSTGDQSDRSRCAAHPESWAVTVALRSGGAAGDGVADAACIDAEGTARSYVYASGETIEDVISDDGTTATCK